MSHIITRPHLYRLLVKVPNQTIGSTRCTLPIWNRKLDVLRDPPLQTSPGCSRFSSTSSSSGIPYHFRGNDEIPNFKERRLYATRGLQIGATSDKRAADDMDVNVNISATQRLLELSEVKGRRASFHATWLRHNCHCSGCKQPHSGQIIVPPHHLRPIYDISRAELKGHDVHIWLKEEPDHVTIIPLDFLWYNDYSLEAREDNRQARKPLTNRGSLPQLTYGELVSGPAGKLRWLDDINKYGICILRGVPQVEGTIKEVAEMIWPIQQTIYGAVFDVVSTPIPINVAYSSAALGLHMDLVYYESPPGIQILHCIRFDDCVEGGESIFVDSWAVAENLREQHPADFNNLTRIPATFQKIHFDREHPVYMRYQKPHIQCNDLGDIIALSWAPPFEGPLVVPEEDIEPYYESYHRFAQMIEDSDTKVEIKLEPGDLVSFINCRILHGRKAFNLNGGVRHLQGCYLNLDEFRSEVEVMSRTVGTGAPSRRVGNHSYS